MHDALESVVPPDSCPLCHFTNKCTYKESHSDEATRQRYDLYECGACRAQFWMPLKNPGAEWYEHDARYAGANADPPREPYWTHRKTISYLRGKVGKVLDIGCGTGNFLSWAKHNGWDVHGIDFDANAVRAAKTIFGLTQVEQSGLEEYYSKNPDSYGTIDLITFFDVFEHIDNHNEFAMHVRTLLRDGGYAAMCMPYRNGSRFMQSKDLPPRHLTRWDRLSLKAFWEQRGFRVLYLRRKRTEFHHIVVKYRHKWGSGLSFGLVDKVKQSVQKGSDINKAAAPQRWPWRVQAARLLAKAKDFALFGIPAFAYWFVSQFSEDKYDGLYAIIQKTDQK